MTEQVVLIVRILAKPGQKPTLLEHLGALTTTMSAEANFVSAVLHDNLDQPDELVVYETWLGTRESWLSEEFPRPYRADYEAALGALIQDRKVDWLVPVTRFGVAQEGMHSGIGTP